MKKIALIVNLLLLFVGFGLACDHSGGHDPEAKWRKNGDYPGNSE